MRYAARLVAAGLAGLLVQACFVKLPETPPLPGTGDATLDAVGADGATPGGDALADSWPDQPFWKADHGSGPPPWDGGALPDLAGDTGDAADAGPIWPWTCPYEPTFFDPVQRSRSFVAKDVALLKTPDAEPTHQDFLLLYYWLCGTEETNKSPERSFIFTLDTPADVEVDVRCDDTCYAAIHRGGCSYDDIVGCWHYASDSLRFGASLLPGIHLLSVEFFGDFAIPESWVHQFDLHVAINATDGQVECVTDSLTADSDVASACDVAGEPASKSTTLSANLTWPDHDDFYLGCGVANVAADPVGGMPDEVHAWQADFGGDDPRLVDVRIAFPEGPPQAGMMLAVTTAPCGAAAAVIDCTWADEGPLELTGITAFPGETLYAVVDAMGEGAFTFEQQPYNLTWTVHEPCLP